MNRIDSLALVEVFSKPEAGFRGNTSVVILAQEAWTPEEMQQMAADWNQPATTFLFTTDDLHAYEVRWFAPDAEIDLCGHGSLAAFAYLFEFSGIKGPVSLRYSQGEITGQGFEKNTAEMNLNAITTQEPQQAPDLLSKALGKEVLEYFPTSNKHIVVLKNEEAVRSMQPDFAMLRQIDVFGYSITAPGNETDFVSRTLVPHVQQLEDHATGSSHAALAPFWAQRLGKSHLSAHQLSPRGGAFYCEVNQNSVKLSGNYRTLARGSLR